jgi:hypothetical protein
MARPIVSTLSFAALALAASGAPASAQGNPIEGLFGAIFGQPSRPPGNAPNRPPGDIPQRLPPGPPPVQQGLPPGPPPGPPLAARPGVQSQPLPPPPGVSSSPALPGPPGQQQGALPRPQPPTAGLPPPGQRSPRGTPQPSNTAPQPDDEVITPPPSQKIANPTAVFSGLDKITGRIIRFDVAADETVQFGALRVTPRACYTRPPTETPNTDAFIEVDEITLQGEVKRIFTGWVFAASPGLHAVEHPIYDVWLVDCKKDAPSIAASKPDPAQR